MHDHIGCEVQLKVCSSCWERDWLEQAGFVWPKFALLTVTHEAEVNIRWSPSPESTACIPDTRLTSFHDRFLCKYVKHYTVYQSDIVFYLDKVSISDVATVTRPKQLNIVLFCGICFASFLVYFFKCLFLFCVLSTLYVYVYISCTNEFLIKNKLPHQ